jgi:hypothetical protein
MAGCQAFIRLGPSMGLRCDCPVEANRHFCVFHTSVLQGETKKLPKWVHYCDPTVEESRLPFDQITSKPYKRDYYDKPYDDAYYERLEQKYNLRALNGPGRKAPPSIPVIH